MQNPTHIVMYSSAWCPFCIQAKRLLSTKGAKFTEIMVDGKPALRAKMMEKSGQRTVPQIWINDNHIGGCDDLYALERNNKLNHLINNK